MMLPLSSRVGLLSALALLALLCSSCQRGRSCYPVQGQVQVGGKPAEGALVIFVPADANPLALRPTGNVAADGSFTLHSYDPEQRTTYTGAPAGPYVVTVTWPDAPAQEEENAVETVEPADRLQGRYGDPATSPLRAEVKEGTNVLPPFELTGPVARGKNR